MSTNGLLTVMEIAEIALTNEFLTELGIGNANVQSLSEFSGKDLKGKSPDVVVSIERKFVGIELTAYHDDDVLDSWGDVKKRILEIIKNIAPSTALRGCFVAYKLKPQDTSNILKDAQGFIEQLLGFALACQGAEPFKLGESRRYLSRTGPANPHPFLHWPLLEKYVDSIRIQSTGVEGIPYIHANLAHNYGTSTDALSYILAAKTKQRATNSHSCGIDDFWLLIHANRHPASSAITQIVPFAAQEILTPQIQTAAKDSGYSRVYLWDCVWGGWIDLVSGSVQEGRLDEEADTLFEC